MEINLSKTEFKTAINIVSKATAKGTNNELNEYILIDVDEKVTLSAFNNLLSINSTIETASIIEKGGVCIKEHYLNNIVSKMPGDKINIKTVNGRVVIKSDNAVFEIECKEAEEFPEINVELTGESIKISQLLLKEMINKTIFSTQKKGMSEILSGECFTFSKDLIKVIALDGTRLSIRNENIECNYDENIILPAVALSKITTLLLDDYEQKVDIFIIDKGVCLDLGATKVVCRKIEGEFIDINAVITKDYETKVIINRKMLLDSIDRSTIISSDMENTPIIWEVEDDKIKLSVNTTNNKWNEEINCEKEGNDIRIGFNPNFIIEALKAIEDEEINMYFTSSISALRIDDDNKYLYIIMPQNI